MADSAAQRRLTLLNGKRRKPCSKPNGRWALGAPSSVLLAFARGIGLSQDVYFHDARFSVFRCSYVIAVPPMLLRLGFLALFGRPLFWALSAGGRQAENEAASIDPLRFRFPDSHELVGPAKPKKPRREGGKNLLLAGGGLTINFRQDTEAHSPGCP